MRRVDLCEATMQGWARLDAAQRERFFQAGLKAALRLNPPQFRAWLLRRLRNRAARRSGRSDALFNFGSRYGGAAENIAFQGERCRSRDRAVEDHLFRGKSRHWLALPELRLLDPLRTCMCGWDRSSLAAIESTARASSACVIALPRIFHDNMLGRAASLGKRRMEYVHGYDLLRRPECWR